jgi:glycosyltransferase involved in cell wall biosynthesis
MRINEQTQGSPQGSESDVQHPAAALDVSVVSPCLNEANSLAFCVEKAISSFRKAGLRGEVIVADNGSTDGSIQIAEFNGATVVHVPQRGYGAALKAGIAAARGEYVVMADADDSYYFREVPNFVNELRRGYDLVMGHRFRGIKSGTIPPLHRYRLESGKKVKSSKLSALTWASMRRSAPRFPAKRPLAPRRRFMQGNKILSSQSCDQFRLI